MIFVYLIITLIWLIFQIISHAGKNRDKLSARIWVTYYGRKLLTFCRPLPWIQILLFLLSYLLYFSRFEQLHGGGVGGLLLTLAALYDTLLCFGYFYLLILAGSICILSSCRSLGVWKRILFICFLWIPVIHLFQVKYLCRRAKIEFDAESCRFENRQKRDGSMICATKYPIIMLHGIGFRDLQYFNYWGRIPKELVQNGAVVYYGHQEAWGTIENNANAISETLRKVLAENHCEKVNLIAHSKGGLDARYLISALHMEDHVASLTTISTPHRGSELLNILTRLPDGIYRFISSLFDRSYTALGDVHPDCYHASRQLSPLFCEEFNQKYPDSSKVYYQSYTSYVRCTFSDPLLFIPNLLMYFAGAPKNDGLVSIESAKWGNFRQTFVSSGKRGISHGDMIDLKREDYKGFDVIEAYVQIVADLKKKGF